MNKNEQDALFRRIASTYAEQLGAQARLELAEIEGSGAAYATPRLDRMVQDKVFGRSKKRTLRTFALIAACIAFALVAPVMLQQLRGGITTSDSGAAQEDSWDFDDDEAIEMDVADDAEYEYPVDDSARPESALESPQAGGMGVIELQPYWLPANLTQTGFEQDNENSVYYLTDNLLDDVVLTLAPADADTAASFEDLAALDITWQPVYAQQTNDYALLTFEYDGVHYTMTCEHDINTLVDLALGILGYPDDLFPNPL